MDLKRNTVIATTGLLTVATIAVSAAPSNHPVKRIAAPAKAAAPATKRPAANVPNTLSGAYNAYIGALRGKIASKWYLPDGKNHVVLSATVAPDGSVTELNLTSTPKDPAAEQAASDAFNQCQPLPVLPEGSNSIRLSLNFDSTADPHGESSSRLSGTVTPLNAAKPDPGSSGNSASESPASSSAGSSEKADSGFTSPHANDSH